MIFRSIKSPIAILLILCGFFLVRPAGAAEFSETQEFILEEFTDESLQTLLSSQDTGILIVWSPQMPLSRIALKNVRKAAKSLGLLVTALLDPDVDPLDTLNLSDIRDEDRVSLRSPLLLSLGITQHFPTIMVFSEGRMIPEVYPGLDTAENYIIFIQEMITQEMITPEEMT